MITKYVTKKTPKGHDPVLWATAQAIKKTTKPNKKTGKLNYSKPVKKYSKTLKLKGEY